MRFSFFLILLFHVTIALSQDWKDLNAAGLQSYQDGKYGEAIEFFQAALETAKMSEGEVSEAYIHSLSNLAFVYKAS
jgi:hypothetical protein